MSNWNEVRFQGRLGHDPESRFTNNSAKQIVSVNMAVNNGKDRPPIWLKVVTMQESTIDKLMQRVKGDNIEVVGSLAQPEAWTSRKDGQAKASISVWADDITHMQWNDDTRSFEPTGSPTAPPTVTPTAKARVKAKVEPNEPPVAVASEADPDYDEIPF